MFYREDYNLLNQMDRVITVQYQLPPEQLILDEDTMLSALEEEALSKCSEAESMVSTKAYACLKRIMREVCRPLLGLEMKKNPNVASCDLSHENNT